MTSTMPPVAAGSLPIPDTETFAFGPWKCKASELFYLTPLSYAAVTLAPVQPGHCLIISRRTVPRVSDLMGDELLDLWALAQRVSGMLAMKANAPSFTFAIQDGVEAGQTVPHVHIHVLPRHRGDFEKHDQVYGAIEKSAAEMKGGKQQSHTQPSTSASESGSDVVHVDEPKRKYRSDAENATEVAQFRAWMTEYEASLTNTTAASESTSAATQQ